MQISDLAVEHRYYCSDENYFSNDLLSEFETWSDFLGEMGNANKDLNLLFRWDLKRDEEIPDNHRLHLYFVLQRKGYFLPMRINKVTDDDAEQIHAFLSERFMCLLEMWAPIIEMSKPINKEGEQ